jgi:hypothetical protein
MEICGDDPNNGNVKKTCPIKPSLDYDEFECYLCGSIFEFDPRQTELNQFDNVGEKTSINKLDIVQEKNQTKIKEYQEDEEWEKSCISVPKRKERITNSDILDQMEKERIRVKRLFDATMSGWGHTVGGSTYTKLQHAVGKANQILGITVGGTSKWERFNPPFDRNSLIWSSKVKAEEQSVNQEGTMNMIFTSMGGVIRTFYDSGLPPRNFYLRKNLINGAPTNGQTYDGIHLFTRVAFELFLNMERRMNKPWSLSRWISQCGLQQNFVKKIIRQGGPLSRDFGEMLTKQHQEYMGSNILWGYFVDGYISNILEQKIIILSDEDKSKIITKANEILKFIEEQQTPSGVYWPKQFLEKFCTIGHNNGEEWRCSGFWWIQEGKICSNKMPMTLPSLLIGQAVAQAIQEVLTNKKIWKADILNIVEDDIHWTTSDGGKAMKLTWKRMMSKRGQGSCWNS